MTPDITYYIDRTKPPKQNPILSLSNASTDEGKLTFVAGDKITVGLVFVSGTDIDTTTVTGSASSSYYYYLAIGEYAGATPYTTTTTWGVSGSWGVTGSLDLNTTALTASLGTNEFIEPVMQLSITQSNGFRQTPMLRKVKIYNAVNL